MKSVYQCEKAQNQHQNELKKREMHSLAMIRFTHAAENGHSGAQYELGAVSWLWTIVKMALVASLTLLPLHREPHRHAA